MHTTSQAIDFCEKAFGPGQLSNGGRNISVVCPECLQKSSTTEKKKLVIRTDNWLVHCWVCGFKGRTLVNLLRKHKPEHLSQYLDQFEDSVLQSLDMTEDATECQLQIPQGFSILGPWLDRVNAPRATKQAIRYLRERNLSDEDIWRWLFGTVEDPLYRNKVIAPSFDENGKLNFFFSRTIVPTARFRFLNPEFKRETTIFNEFRVDFSKEVCLVEGVFDAVVAGENVVPLLGKELSREAKLFQRLAEFGTKVVVALDSDANKQALKLCNDLYPYCEVRFCDLGGYKDPGCMDKKLFAVKRESAILYSPHWALRYRLEGNNENRTHQ
jgi:hypothetical protein